MTRLASVQMGRYAVVCQRSRPMSGEANPAKAQVNAVALWRSLAVTAGSNGPYFGLCRKLQRLDSVRAYDARRG